jgi:hypothetical protein
MKAPVFVLLLLFLGGCLGQKNLEITPIMLSSVMFNYGGIVVYIDPTTLPYQCHAYRR